MKLKIRTLRLLRLPRKAGIQITATIRPDKNLRRLRRKLLKLVRAGVSHFRINLSHFSHDSENAREEWSELLVSIDDIRTRLGTPVGIMLDTSGPEFRLDTSAVLDLARGTRFQLVADRPVDSEGVPSFRVSMPEGFESFGGAEIVNKEIRFNDGQGVAIVVQRLGPCCLLMEARHPLRLAKGGKVNFPDLRLPGVLSVSSKDRVQLELLLTVPRSDFARKHNPHIVSRFIPVEFVAQSFVRFPEDVKALSVFLESLNLAHQPFIVPKIETKHAVNVRTLKAIIAMPETAAVMIARGDLASECERWQVPAKQREIIRISHSMLKPVLIATEVYGSMGCEPFPWQPNRGEVTDVRHALEAAVDGIVFTKETGARPDPETTVEYLVKQEVNDLKDIRRWDLWNGERERRRQRLTKIHARTRRGLSPGKEYLPWRGNRDLDAAEFAMGGDFRANARHAPIVAVTANGNIVSNLVHFLPYGPIIAVTSSPRTLARLSLFAHVHPVLVDALQSNFDVKDLQELVLEIMERFSVGDEVLALMPHPVGLETGLDTVIFIKRQAANPRRDSHPPVEAGFGKVQTADSRRSVAVTGGGAM
jgi:pyruvate kinase